MCSAERGALRSLLAFATGLDRIPSVGFDPRPKITFGHAEDLEASDQSLEYPKANTCANSIRLPILRSLEKFKANMHSALSMCSIFTDY